MSPIVINVTTDTGDFDLVRGSCKRVWFTFNFPHTSHGVVFSAVNEDFDNEKFVTWCRFGVLKVNLYS